MDKTIKNDTAVRYYPINSLVIDIMGYNWI